MPFLETLLGKMLVTFFIAMVPVVELRGAVPYGIAQGLPLWLSCMVAIIGNLVPVPFVMLLSRRIFAWLRRGEFFGRRIQALERHAHTKGELVRRYSLPGLILLVGIPLPGTGAWTGALVATVLGLRMREALPAILAGLLIAGALTAALSCGVFAILR